ncbi:MAG: glycosyltransferase family 39 protein [Polynucleobacter sp.]|nr:glycosyltransferase family 39 protein [Polynucleobacter sp.]MDZ4056314.1 glycosyltransferase family 39 protein [Polynucleobacter sp.]
MSMFGPIHKSSRLLTPAGILLLGIFYAVLWFGTLDYRHLIPSDEGRYAEIAREMVVSGDWVSPRYHDYKYFYKPPLQLWATATAFDWFGVGEWQARLWTALTGFLTILFVGYTSARLDSPRAGWIAAVVLAASPMWVISGHVNSLDMALSAFLTAALCSLLLAQTGRDKKGGGGWMMLCWAFMALATLSKGLIGAALPTLVLIAYSVTAWDWRIWKRLYIVRGLLLFFAITAPWFILISIRNPEFVEFFFIHEHFERFTQDVHRRSGPIYFFLPLLAIGFLPFLFQLPGSLLLAWKSRQGNFAAAWMLACWFLIIFAFFSVSRSKLPGYIIPIFPALAMLVGRYLDRQLGQTNTLSIPWIVQTACFAILGFVGFFFLSFVGVQARPDEITAYAEYTQWIAVALIILISFSALAAWQARRNGVASIASLAIGFFLTSIVAGTGHETLGRAVSGVDLAERVRNQIPADAPIYSVRILDHTVPFYLGRTMIMVEFPDELAFGVKQEPERWAPTLNDFIERWKSQTNAYAFMVPEQYAELERMGLPMEIVDRDTRRIIVKHPTENLAPATTR